MNLNDVKTVQGILERTNRKLVQKIHQYFEIFRLLIENHKDELEKINATYEVGILRDILLLPEKHDPEILRMFMVIEIFIKNINFNNISKDLRRIDIFNKNPHLHINLLSIIKDQAIPQIKSQTVRERVRTVVNELERIINSMNFLINDPFRTIEKICAIYETRYNNLLD
jgi:hypothetical protein